MESNLVSKKRMSVILILILLLLLLLTTKVYAANDKFNTTLNANNLQVKREDNITITIGLKDIAIESGEKGIGAYTARVKFDSSVLEYVSTNGTDNWEAPFYQNGLITGNTKNGEVVKTAQSIGTITFKVKKDAKLGETEIQLTNFSGTTVENDVVTADQTIKITIVDKNSNNNNNNNNNENNNNNNNINNSTNEIMNDIEIKNNTIASGKLPQTGEREFILIGCIGLFIIGSVISYIKMRKNIL